MNRRRMEEELDRDIQDHIALEIADNIARGMSPADARHAALRKFGNIARVKEDTRSVWPWAALDTWRADLRHAFRRMRRSPGPAALAVLSLALAFAPSVTVFSIMDRLFLSASGIRAPEQILSISFQDARPNAPHFVSSSYPEYQDFRRSLRSFSGLTYQFGKFAMVALRRGRSPLTVNVVNDDYFGVLGVSIRLGPGFLKDRPSVIISHGLWMREFDGRPDAIGRSLLVNGVSFSIDGVTPADYRGVDRVLAPDVWIPLDAWLQAPFGQRASRERRDFREGNIWGRLRPGVSPQAAAAEVESVTRGLAEQWPATNRYLTGYTYALLVERQGVGVKLTSFAVILFGILMAVACANVTGILLARAEERRYETAVRQTLGASRGRLMREWMVESAVLSAFAAGLGLACARLLMDRLPALLPTMMFPIYLEFSFGPRVWLYAAALVVMSTLAFGLVPAWRASRPDLLSGLRRDSAVSLLHVRVPVRSLLIVVQVAAAELLLFSAGLVLDTVSAVGRLAPGFDPRRPVVVAAMVATGEDAGFRPVDAEAVRDRLARVAGVRRVAYGRSMPLSGSMGPALRLELPGNEPREVRGGSTGPGFLSTLGVQFLSGRDLEAADGRAVVVDSALARLLDPSGRVVGREIRLDGAIRPIVGVFQDAKWNSVYDPPRPRAIALAGRSLGDMMFAIEVDGNPAARVQALRSELAAAQPGASVLSPKTLWQHYQDALFIERSLTRVFYGLGILALLLTVTGLHGIASALFARRSREFAIRLALGAPPRELVASVLANALKLAFCGLALGLAIGLPCAIALASRQSGFSPWSASALGLSSAAVIVAAVVAAARPATRVLRIEPGKVVRAE